MKFIHRCTWQSHYFRLMWIKTKTSHIWKEISNRKFLKNMFNVLNNKSRERNLHAGVEFVPRSKYPGSSFLFSSSGITNLFLEISKLGKGDNDSLAVKSHCPISQNLNLVNCTSLIWHMCMHKTHTQTHQFLWLTLSAHWWMPASP